MDSPNPDAVEPKPYDALGEARRLLREVRAGALATFGPDGPFASLVSVATHPDGSPLLLLSRLAAHTHHLLGDPRCSLLLAEGGKGDPLAHARLTLVGEATENTPADRLFWRARFLNRHPKAALYADFGDFAFWRLVPGSAHLNGGFARAAVFDGTAVMTRLAGAEALVESEAAAIEHMNADHADAVRLFATALADAGQGAWRVSGIDPDGVDLACGDRTARLAFPERVTGPGMLRRVLVDWTARAREKTASDQG